jgi:hypothetical protein
MTNAEPPSIECVSLPLGSVYMTSKLTGLECRFNITMDPAKGDIAELSTCTTCRFKEDKSNYWTAVLYFKHRNGSFIRVSAPFTVPKINAPVPMY